MMYFIVCLIGGIIAGFCITILFYRSQYKKRRKQGKKKIEFSKLVVASVMLTYYIAAGAALKYIFQFGTGLAEFLTFVGSATATTIGFYCWKAKNENMHKNPDVMAEIPPDNSDFYK